MQKEKGYSFPLLHHIQKANQIMYTNGDNMSWYCLKFYDAGSLALADKLIIPREDYKSIVI